MQFFPADTSSDFMANAVQNSMNALHSVVEKPMEAAGQSFENVMDNLAEYQEMTAGIPEGFRSVNDDHAQYNNDDLSNLNRALEKKGLSKEAREALEEFRKSEAKPTVSGLLNAMRGTSRRSSNLTEQEELDLMAICQKLGFSADEISQISDLAKQGQGGHILQAINGKLNALNGGVDIFPNECKALLRAMDLSSTTRESIMGMFAGQEKFTADAASFSMMLGQAGKELGQLDSNRSRLAVEAHEAVNIMLEKARQRKQTEPATDKRGDKKSDQAERLMRDSATTNGEGNATQRKSSLASLNAEPEEGQSGKLGEKFFRQDMEHAAGLRKDAQRAEDRWHEQRAQAAEGKNRKAETQAEGAGQEKRQAKAASPASGTNSGTVPGMEARAAALEGLNPAPANFNPAAQAAPANSAAAQVGQNGAMPVYYEKLFSQVERGILQHATDGSRQITMRLDPPELGQLTLTLSVNKGELKAFIVAESNEASAAISEQLAALKTALEDQGLKVESLEVETRLQENPQENSSGNLWAREESQAREEQLRENTNFLSFSRRGMADETSLARNVQNSLHRETISQQGLHIIA